LALGPLLGKAIGINDGEPWQLTRGRLP